MSRTDTQYGLEVYFVTFGFILIVSSLIVILRLGIYKKVKVVHKPYCVKSVNIKICNNEFYKAYACNTESDICLRFVAYVLWSQNQ
jgi:hypothetical protein